MGLMCTYFILVDTGRRNFPEHFKRPLLGPFLISGVAATLGWWVVWPFEYMKSQVQSGYAEYVDLTLQTVTDIAQLTYSVTYKILP